MILCFMEFKRAYREYPGGTSIRHLLAAPVVYSLFFPLASFDLCLEIYHRICFPLYGLPYVKRSKYFLFDRQRLPYLTRLEKFNCFYCSYANGLVCYATVIFSETEGYWCGIQHQKRAGFQKPLHQKDFLPYGDESAFRKFVDG